MWVVIAKLIGGVAPTKLGANALLDVGFYMPKYLQKRRQGWYAVLEIPKELRGVFGKSRFKETLKTQSLTEAKIRVLGVVQEWKQQIEAVRGTPQQGRGAGIDPDAWRTEIRRQKALGAEDWEVVDALRDVAEELASETDGDDAYVAYSVAVGKSVLLSEHLQDYLNDTVSDPKSKDMKSRHLLLFFKRFKLAEDVNSTAVSDWIESVLLGELGISHKTAKTYLSTYRTFWRYLGKKKLVPKSVEAFTDVLEAPQKPLKSKRAYFTPEDYRRLLEASQEDYSLNDLIRLGAYTGARIEEICSLKVSDTKIDKGFFTITASKTEAGMRQIPIHPAIKQLVARLIETSSDGYLLSGLAYNKYGDRSNAIGKRFGRLKNSLGYGRELVFHSFRRGVATQFESAKVPEVLAARILGHDFPTMSFGIYSGGADIETLREAIEVLEW